MEHAAATSGTPYLTPSEKGDSMADALSPRCLRCKLIHYRTFDDSPTRAAALRSLSTVRNPAWCAEKGL